MAVDTGRLPLLSRWCGLALVAAGGLMVGATLLHPSRETASTIVASEWQLVAAHVVYTVAWLLGAARPSWGLCGPARRDGTAGIGRFFECFLRYLFDRGDRELRFPRPGFGQAV